MSSLDLVIVGGGLSGGLLAYRLRQMRPGVRLLLLEGGAHPGGNHTWSFHDGDLEARQAAWMAPFVAHRWPAYEVRFPERRRRIATGYASISSERFAGVLEASLGSSLRCDAPVVGLSPNSVTLQSGERIEARAVIDARGPRQTPHLQLRFQKFLGQEVAFEQSHGLAVPIVMDASVRQADGYRFVYCLPFSPTRMLIEDTYYADGPEVRREVLQDLIASYARGAGWGAFKVLREEEGVLPIALGGDIEAHLASLREIPAIGLVAALFHPTTGYSLPDAVRTADLVAGLDDFSPAALKGALDAHARRVWSERGYFRALNRMLFGAGESSERYRVLQHFHRLPDDLIGRFYAGRLRRLDKLRVLAGKPPVPVVGALRALLKGPA